MAEMRSAVPIQRTGTGAGFGTGLPSSAITRKRMAGQGKAANLGRASIQNVKENALAWFDANRLTVTEHAAVDGERAIANLVSVRHAFGKRRLHRGLAAVFKGLDFDRGKEILWHIAAATEGWLEFLQDEKYFAIVVSGLVPGLDVDWANLPAVLARAKFAPARLCV